MIDYLAQSRGENNECSWSLMTSWSPRGRQVVALQNIFVLGFALVERIVFSANGRNFKHVAH